MTSQAGIQAKVSKGLSIVAKKLGAPCQWYRPTAANNPLDTQYLMGTIDVAFDNSPRLTMISPHQRAKPENVYAACDVSKLQVSDYLVEADGSTYFVSVLDVFTPARLVQCNGTASVYRPYLLPVGPEYYGGDVSPTGEVLIMGSWPCSIVQGTKGEHAEMRLPGDTRMPWYSVLMPAVAGVQIRSGDILLDQQATPLRYTISSVELTDLGWRLSAALANP